MEMARKVFGHASCKLQGVSGMLLKVPSIWITQEFFDNFGVAYEAVYACVVIFGQRMWQECF